MAAKFEPRGFMLSHATHAFTHTERLSNYCVSRIAGLVETAEEMDVIPLSHSVPPSTRRFSGSGERWPYRSPSPSSPRDSRLHASVHRRYCMQLAAHRAGTSAANKGHPLFADSPFVEGIHPWRGDACKRGVMHFARLGTAACDRHLYGAFGTRSSIAIRRIFRAKCRFRFSSCGDLGNFGGILLWILLFRGDLG